MKFFYRWGPAIMWMAVIFFFSSRHSVTVSPQYIINFLFFKALHVLEYAVLFVLYFRATKNFFLAFLLTILYASTDEFHQLFITSREGSIRDVIIDALGAGSAWIMITKLLPKVPQKLQKLARHWLTN